MARAQEKLGNILMKLGLLNKQELKQVLSAQQIFGGRIGTNTVNLNLLTVDQVSTALSKQKGVPEASQELFLQAGPAALNVLSPEMCSKYHIFPLHLQGRVLHLAMRDPDSLTLIDEISFTLGMRVRPYVTPELRLAFYLHKHYEIPRERHLQAYIDVAGEEQQPPGTGRQQRTTATGRANAPGWSVALTPIEDVPDEGYGVREMTPAGQPAPPRPTRDTGRGHAPPGHPTQGHPARQARQTSRPMAPRRAPTPPPAAPPRVEARSGPETVSLDDYQLPPEVLEQPPVQQPAPPAQQPAAPVRRPVDLQSAATAGHDLNALTPAPLDEHQATSWETEPQAESWRPRRQAEGFDTEVDGSEMLAPAPAFNPDEGSLDFELGDEGASYNRAPAGFNLSEQSSIGEELDLNNYEASGAPKDFPQVDHTPIGYSDHVEASASAQNWAAAADDLALHGAGDLGDPADYWEPDEETPGNRHEEVAAASVAAVRGQLDPILELMETASDSNTILSSMVEPFLSYTTVIVVFVPRKDTVVALRASGSHLDAEAVREMTFSLTNSPSLTSALKNKALACVRVEDDPIHEMIAEHLGAEAPGEVLVAPVVMGDRVVNILCAQATKGRSFDALARSFYNKLASEAALAFARLIKQKKQ